MDAARDNRAFRYAVLFSVAFHLFVLFGAPALKETSRRMEWPGPIIARLVEPAPAPAPSAEEPKPPKIKPAAKPSAQPTVKPLPSPKPAPVVKAAPEAPSKPVPEAAPAPTPAPSAATPPVAPAPPGGAEQPVAEDAQLLIGRYVIELKGEAAKRIRYPSIARQEGWQGKGEIRLQIGANGMIVDLRVIRTSGYAVIDRAVADGVRSAHADVPLHPGLRGRAFQISIPFELNLTQQ